MRDFTAMIYMGPQTYYSLEVQAVDLIQAAKVAVGACLDANPFWRVVRLSEVSKVADEAPLRIAGE
jgi:hypothetical protein